jgi:hypothetical protein
LNDLRGKLANVSNPRAQALLNAFPINDDMPLFARRVELPRTSTGNLAVRRENAFQLAPSYDKEASAFSVTFIHEVVNGQGGYTGSSIWAVIEAWRAYVRAGQQLTPGSQELALSLNDAMDDGYGLRVTYAYDIGINLLAGVSPTMSFTDGVTSFDLNVVARYQALKAWPAEVGLANLATYEAAQVLEIPVTFTCDSFSTVPGMTLIPMASANVLPVAGTPFSGPYGLPPDETVSD